MLYFYVYSALQIVLESFPVSSSSHLILLERYLQKSGYAIDHHQGFFFDFLHFDFVSIDVLEHFLHGVTIFVLALFFFPQWRIFVTHLTRSWRCAFKIILLTALADSVTLALYLMRPQVFFICPSLGIGLLITALLLLSLRCIPEKRLEKKRIRFSWRTALVLGCVQGIALLPGISRFASVYAAARWCALGPRRAFEITFLIQWPLILLAFANSVRMIAAHTNAYYLFDWGALVVMLSAGVLAWYGLRFVHYCAGTGRLWLFAFYMLVPLAAWFVLC